MFSILRLPCYLLLNVRFNFDDVFSFRIFDKNDDGFITVEDLRHIMQSLGEKMTDGELDEMIAEADSDKDGLIKYQG